jgi:hypothetical protein
MLTHLRWDDDPAIDSGNCPTDGTTGAGGTFADLQRWLREADLIGIQTEDAGAMAVFEAGKPNRGSAGTRVTTTR